MERLAHFYATFLLLLLPILTHAKEYAAFAPPPGYPAEAKTAHFTGSGVFALQPTAGRSNDWFFYDFNIKFRSKARSRQRWLSSVSLGLCSALAKYENAGKLRDSDRSLASTERSTKYILISRVDFWELHTGWQSPCRSVGLQQIL